MHPHDTSQHDVAAGRAFADANNAVQSALKGHRYTGYPRRADHHRRRRSNPKPLELAFLETQHRGRGIHSLSIRGRDRVHHELPGGLDVPHGVFGGTVPMVDRTKHQSGRTRTHSLKKAERRQIGHPGHRHGAHPGDGPRHDRVDHPLVHRPGIELVWIEFHHSLPFPAQQEMQHQIGQVEAVAAL